MMTRSPRRQYGLTIVELLIALAIGWFLLLTMYAVFAATRTTLTQQSAGAQLQDDQRAALTIVGNIAQLAGYFPNPTLRTRADAFPAAASPSPTVNAPFALKQIVFGGPSGISLPASASPTSTASTTGDLLAVRFYADPAKTYDCLGSSAASGTVVTNILSVSASQELQCQVDPAAGFKKLIGASSNHSPGIQSMHVLFGVDTTTPTAALPAPVGVTRYLDSTQMTGYWDRVLSVQVRLTFINPLAGQAGEPATFDVIRNIALQNQL